MALLLLNRRDILDRLPHWFPDSRECLVVVTASEVFRPSQATEFLDVVVLDAYDTTRIVDAARRVHSGFGIERILSTAESDVLRAARLRRELGIAGQGIESATSYRDKFHMKSIARSAGVAVAPMVLATDAGQVLRFAGRVGYPIVLKKRDGAASIGMHFAHDANQLNQLLRKVPGQNFLAERFVKGEMYHVDGIMTDGKVVHAWPSRYLYSQWETAYRGRPNISGMLGFAHPLFAALQDCASKVVSALPPVPNICAFHCELFHTGDLEIVLCEIACRPGGAGIVEAYELAFGANLHGMTLLGQAGRSISQEIEVPVPGRRYGWAHFPPICGRLLELPRHCPLPNVVNFRAVAEPGLTFGGARFVTDHVATMLFSIEQTDPAAELRAIVDWWNASVRWEVIP